ncbi:glycosyl hydrolase family 20, catalytic domain protein, partial [gut metagenome]
GLNQIYLYMEDVYEIPEDPYFGAYRGRYRYEELKKLDEYGKNVGVELIPCIQTLAHLRTYLKWPQARKLRDTSDILLVGSKETEKFVRAMIQNA